MRMTKFGTCVFPERSPVSGGGLARRKPAAGEDATSRSVATVTTAEIATIAVETTVKVNVVTESEGQHPEMKKVSRLFVQEMSEHWALNLVLQ